MLAMLARAPNRRTLGVDSGDCLQNFVGGPNHDEFLLPVEQAEHLAVMLQFFAEGFDEAFEFFDHVEGLNLEFSPVDIAGAESLIKSWRLSCFSRLRGRPKPPDLLMESASCAVLRS